MQKETGRRFRQLFAVALGIAVSAPTTLAAQGPGTEDGQWAYLGGDSWHTRYTTADEITADNFGEMTELWRFNAASFGPSTPRATPSYVNGMMITVTGDRRHVIALNPENGEVIWTFTEPNTHRHEYSMRKAYGKGISYAEVPGRGGVVFISTPGFFLHALAADTGQPLEDWGGAIPLEGFPESGSIDLVADLIDGWGPWEDRNEEFDPYMGIPLEIGYITSSSPPIVVNGTVIVNNSAEQGYLQTRVENVPGDILAYDAATGEQKWKFHIIPRPGEFGHDTWESDAWEWTGDVSSWAPMASDPELGLVYIVTNGVTIDYFGGFHPGDNLFSTSMIALDAETGERRWHYQFVHHDIWNYDTPTAPILMDVTVDGREVKGVFQATKQAFLYALDRETGEPIWPIEERPVPQSQVPGERLSPTQPIPTRPAAYDLQGRTTEHLIDYTPEIYERALQLAQDNNQLMAFFEPPRAQGDPRGPARVCPGDSGGTNITGPAVGDPVNGIVFVSSSSGCSGMNVSPGAESALDGPTQSGTTYTDFAAYRGSWPVAGAAPAAPGGGRGGRGFGRGGLTLDGLPIWKGPQGRIVAIDVNTGDHLWTIPNGDAPQAQQDLIRNHPLLQGLDIDESVYNRGRGGPSAMVVTPDLLLAGGLTADNQPSLFAIDKMTGERVGAIEIPGQTRYGMSSWEHNGHQYVIIQLQDGLAAYGLPAAIPQAGDAH